MSPTESLPITVTVPEYGLIAFGLGTNPSYEAARRGDFPTIEYGIGQKVKRLRVAVRPALARIAGSDQAMLEALTKDFAAKWRALTDSKREKWRDRKTGAS